MPFNKQSIVRSVVAVVAGYLVFKAGVWYDQNDNKFETVKDSFGQLGWPVVAIVLTIVFAIAVGKSDRFGSQLKLVVVALVAAVGSITATIAIINIDNVDGEAIGYTVGALVVSLFVIGVLSLKDLTRTPRALVASSRVPASAAPDPA